MTTGSVTDDEGQLALEEPDLEEHSLEEHSLEERMAELALRLDESQDLEMLLAGVTTSALELVPGCDFAGVTLLRPGGRLESAATTCSLTDRADAWQYDLNEGPCVDAARDAFLVVTDDVEHDDRWPAWGPAVSEFVGSVLSVQVMSSQGTHGALNLYASGRGAFTKESIKSASILSIHAGIAMRTALLEKDLAASVSSRALIGQAQGLLMHKFDMDAEASFAVLRRLSQHHNTRLVELAQEIVDTRGELRES